MVNSDQHHYVINFNPSGNGIESQYYDLQRPQPLTLTLSIINAFCDSS